MVHLGSLRINNTFTDNNNKPFETYHVNIFSIQIYRYIIIIVCVVVIVIVCSHDDNNNNHILKPFGLNLIIKRNLSSDYKLYPMAAVDLVFEPLEVC